MLSGVFIEMRNALKSELRVRLVDFFDDERRFMRDLRDEERRLLEIRRFLWLTIVFLAF